MSSKSKEANAEQVVLEYLLKENRPYSAIDVFNNLHKELGKTAVSRALESLARSSGKIREKTYGKQKIYFADQSQFPTVKDDALAAMDAQIVNMSRTLKELQECIRQKEKLLAGINSSLTTHEVKSKLKTTSEEAEELQTKLDNLMQSKGPQVTKEEKQEVDFEYQECVKQWRKRKRVANDMIDAVLEGYPKGKKALLEEVGIETDEDANVTIPKL